MTLVNIKGSPIERLTPQGLVVRGQEYAVDSIIFATGFDAVTGALSNIDVRGRGGQRLNDYWTGAPRAYLGLMSVGFPNLFFLDGPCANGALVSPLLLSEYQVEWVDRCMAHLGTDAAVEIEPTPAAEADWMRHMEEVAEGSLLYEANSWYMGANIPGKPRVFLPYIGGFGTYRKLCDEIAAKGYEGFTFA